MRKYNRSYLDEAGVKVKLCGRCNRTFPRTAEYFTDRGKYGLSSYCIKCTLEVAKKSKIKNRTRKGEYKPRFKNLITYVEGVKYKRCNICHTDYPATNEFYDANNKGQGSLQPKCKNCRQDYNHKYSKTHWHKVLIRNSIQVAARKNLAFDIDGKYLEDLMESQNGKCYWTGVNLVPSDKQKYPLQPSVDRLDCSKGYIKGNIVLCCFVANMGRNNTSIDEFKKFLLSLREEMEFSQWEN